jgi:hypothetical protein
MVWPTGSLESAQEPSVRVAAHAAVEIARDRIEGRRFAVPPREGRPVEQGWWTNPRSRGEA